MISPLRISRLLVREPRPYLVLQELPALVEKDLPAGVVGEAGAKVVEGEVVVGQALHPGVGRHGVQDVGGAEQAGRGCATLRGRGSDK